MPYCLYNITRVPAVSQVTDATQCRISPGTVCTSFAAKTEPRWRELRLFSLFPCRSSFNFIDNFVVDYPHGQPHSPFLTTGVRMRPSSKSDDPAPVRRKQIHSSCESCHRRKVRCDVNSRGAPCTNCHLDEQRCVLRLPLKRYAANPPVAVISIAQQSTVGPKFPNLRPFALTLSPWQRAEK